MALEDRRSVPASLMFCILWIVVDSIIMLMARIYLNFTL
jgi:hypothetical protein